MKGGRFCFFVCADSGRRNDRKSEKEKYPTISVAFFVRLEIQNNMRIGEIHSNVICDCNEM